MPSDSCISYLLFGIRDIQPHVLLVIFWQILYFDAHPAHDTQLLIGHRCSEKRRGRHGWGATGQKPRSKQGRMIAIPVPAKFVICAHVIMVVQHQLQLLCVRNVDRQREVLIPGGALPHRLH